MYAYDPDAAIAISHDADAGAGAGARTTEPIATKLSALLGSALARPTADAGDVRISVVRSPMYEACRRAGGPI